MIALKELFRICEQEKSAPKPFFEKMFKSVKIWMEKNKKTFMSEDFGSGEKVQKDLAKIIVSAIREDQY